MINYTVERSKRKTMAVVVKGDGSVIVKAPVNMPLWQIERFIDAKSDWIQKAVSESRKKKNRFSGFGLEEGNAMLLFGKAVTVKNTDGKKISCDGKTLYLPEADNRRDLMIRFMKQELKKYITSRIDCYAPIMQVTPADIKTGSAKTRWGSCSGKNSLNFSYRLAMCPEAVIDYVVVHELAHIKYHDHSPSFWRFVAEVMPQYKQMKNWLRENSFIMEVV